MTHKHLIICPLCSLETVTGTNHSKPGFLGGPQHLWPEMAKSCTLQECGASGSMWDSHHWMTWWGLEGCGMVATQGCAHAQQVPAVAPAPASGTGVLSPGIARAAIPRGSQHLACLAPSPLGHCCCGAVWRLGTGETGTGRGSGDPGPYVKGLWQSCGFRGKMTVLHQKLTGKISNIWCLLARTPPWHVRKISSCPLRLKDFTVCLQFCTCKTGWLRPGSEVPLLQQEPARSPSLNPCPKPQLKSLPKAPT